MPRVTLLPNGSSGGFAGPGRLSDDGGKKRDVVNGWTPGAARRSTEFLWSVNAEELGDDGWALTLTMGGRPETPEEWHRARRNLMKSLAKAGAVRQHWVMEWTAEGRPHLHMAVYGPRTIPHATIRSWFRQCERNGWVVDQRGQHIVPIEGLRGWLEYVSKHAARGVAHYQREGSPVGWARTGRLWGHWGAWPVEERFELDVTHPQFYRWRRLVIGYQRAKLRRLGTPKKSYMRVGHALKDRESGRYAGIGYWIPVDVSYRLLVASAEGGSLGRYEWEE